MRTLMNLLALGGLFMSISCRGPKGSVPQFGSMTASPSPANGAGISMPIQTQNQPGTAGQAESMPFFIEVTQTTTMAGTFLLPPSIQVGPSAYSYGREGKVLLLNSSIVIAWSSTELVIGEATILETPAQSHENRNIYQYPPEQPTVFEVLKFDAATGLLEFTGAGETHVLPAGETRTFKQTGAGSNPTTMVTTFVNHGRLADIQFFSLDGSLP